MSLSSSIRSTTFFSQLSRGIRTVWNPKGVTTYSSGTQRPSRYPINHTLTSSITTVSSSTLLHSPIRAATLSSSSSSHRNLATRAELAARQSVNQNSTQFSTAVQTLFTTIERACNEGGMTEKNPGFRVYTESILPSNRLQCHILAGNHQPDVHWILETDPILFRISMASTKIAGASGVLYYTYNIATGQWVNDKDKHFLVELLTRDLIHYCKGFPAF